MLEVFDEAFELVFSFGWVGEAEEVAGVDGGDDFGGEVGEGVGLEASLGEDLELGVDEGLGGGGSEGDDDFGLDFEDFGEDPGLAVVDFFFAGFVVEAAFGLWFEFEVLDGVGEVEFFALEAGCLEGLVEELAGGANEGASGDVFLVSGLFADDHDAGIGWAFAKDGLGGGFVEGAVTAGGGGFVDLLQGEVLVLDLGEGFVGGEAELVGVGMLRAERGVGGDVGAVVVGALFDHLDGAVGGSGSEFGDEGGFGEIFPILLGHLGLHGFELEAGGVEDTGVVGAPVVFEFVVLGCLRGVDAFGEDEFVAIPVGTAVGGEDRPVEGGKSFREKGRGQLYDEVSRLEPSDELFAAGVGVFADFAKADEGFHLVTVAGDFFGEGFESTSEEVSGDAEETFFAVVDAVDGFVEERPALGVAVASDEVGEFEKGFGAADFGEVAGVVVGLSFLD